jgi:hypothetical protein
MDKRKKQLLILLFAILGAGCFTAFSALEISPFLKSYLAIIPLQVLALIYVWYWRSKKSLIK